MQNSEARALALSQEVPPSLRQLAEISEAMREEAAAEDWQTVAALHARFARLLPASFAEPVDGQFADVIARLIDNARWVSDRAAQQREVTQEALRALKVTAPVARAYAAHQA